MKCWKVRLLEVHFVVNKIKRRNHKAEDGFTQT